MSYSRLEVYAQCPKKFEHRYILKTPYQESFNKDLFVGKHTHTLLEHRLKGNYTAKQGFNILLPTWLAELNVIIDEHSLSSLYEVLYGLSDILYRCSSFYSGKDPIRKQDGSYLKNPIEYPTKELRLLLAQTGLNQLKNYFNEQISEQNSDLAHHDLIWYLAEVLYMALYFKVPKAIDKTLAVEMSLSDNEDLTLDFKNLNVLGSIDWVAQLTDGKIIIIDHKTNAEKPSQESVKLHPQLNFYAYCYWKTTGVRPDLIGINHLRSRHVIISNLEDHIMQEVIEHLKDLCYTCYKKPHLKKFPTVYGSPCMSKSWKTGEITKVCPFLKHCWASTYDLIQDKL
jgi:hypothetical protein